MTKTDIKNLSADEVNALRDEVMEKLDYDAFTGAWYWKHGKNVSPKVRGMRAGCVQKAGYLTIRLHGELFYAQRLAWLVVYGVWPMVGVEIVDRNNKANTTIGNLRVRTTVSDGVQPMLTPVVPRIDLGGDTPCLPVITL